ncbi:MAG TPA: MATE family efflux transporter [Ignavibacteriaceae bacterium]|nr:MATE family efflux transporter [Ignavibacteriaceae bacterium]
MTSPEKPENISSRLFLIGVPIIIQSLVQYIQLQVDIVFLGHYKPIMLSAVGNVVFPYFIHVSFILTISMGATIIISHCLGAGDIQRAKRYSEVSFFYNTVISILFFIYLSFLAPAILNLLGTPAEVHSYASDYMSILSYSFLLLGIEYSITATLQGMGITKHIMYAGIIRTAINTFLAWLLIFGNGGFPQMGIRGAAIATVISNYIAAAYFILIFSFSRNLTYKASIKGVFHPEWKIEKESIVVGFPSGLESMLWSFGQIVIISIVNKLDAYSSGLYIVVNRIQAFTFFIYLGIARATMVLVGQKIGAGKPEEAVQVGIVSLRYGIMLCVFIGFLFIAIPKEIISIFTSEARLISRVSNLLYIAAVTIFPVAVNVITGNAIRGMKDTKWMLYTQILGTTFTISMSALMIFVFHLNLMGVFLTILFDESFRACLNFLRFYKGKEFFFKFVKFRRVAGSG